MAILKNVELHFAKLNPKRPNATFNTENPSWEVQIRTTDKKVVKEWKALNINVNPVREDKEDEDSKIIYYKASLKKRSKKWEANAEGKKVLVPSAPVKVVSGTLEDINPDSIGNGSLANIRLFQYEQTIGEGAAEKQIIVSMLMAVQVTKLNEYIPKAREDEFTMEEFSVNSVAEANKDDLNDDIEF